MDKKQIIIKDYLLTGAEFKVNFDLKAGIGQTKIPPKTNFNAFYPKDNYDSHQDHKKGLSGMAYNLIQRLMFRYKYLILKRYSQGKSVLDIGGGTGAFGAFFSKKGYEVILTEPSDNARIEAKKKGLFACASLKDLPSKKTYSIVTLWHVFEHLPDPSKALTEYHKLLKDNGLLVLALPNYSSFDAKYYQEQWAAYDVPRHLWHYTPKGIRMRVGAQGFRLQKAFPLWFDSFYIAYLSERYQKNKFPLVRGLFIGLLSNLSALVTGQYSSLIYVFRKES